MAVKNYDPIMQVRGNNHRHHDHTLSATLPASNATHKVQKPSNGKPDPILNARSSSPPVGLKRQGSIGVGGSSPTNGGTGGILKETTLSPRYYSQHGNDDSSLESIGVFEGFNTVDTAALTAHDNNDQLRLEIDDTFDTFDRIATFDKAANNTANPGSPNSETSQQRRVRWGPSVKAGSSRGLCGLHSTAKLPSFKIIYQGIVGSLSDMKLMSKLDGGAQKLGRGLEGLGMTCVGSDGCSAQKVGRGLQGLGSVCVGGGRMLCGACGSACVDTMNGEGTCRCAKCGLVNNKGISSHLLVDEDNDLVCSQSPPTSEHQNQQQHQLMPQQESMLQQTRLAIQESRDAIVASYEEMRESRQCIDESRVVMNDVREAIMIQGNNAARLRMEDQLSRETSGKMFTFNELGLGVGGNDDGDERDDVVLSMNSPRSKQQGDANMYYNSAVEKYRHSSSLRSSMNNIETGMGNANAPLMIAADNDPFSASMRGYQKSPRAFMASPMSNHAVVHETHSPTGPVSILKKNRRNGTNNAARTASAPRSRRFHHHSKNPSSPPVTSATAAASSRAKQLVSVGTRRNNKDKRFRTTKGVSVKNHTKSPSSSDWETPTQEQAQQRTKTTKKKKMSRRVLTGLKKPLKLMSHGVKTTLMNKTPKRMMALTAKDTPRGHHERYYE